MQSCRGSNAPVIVGGGITGADIAAIFAAGGYAVHA
jgi:3-hydroxyacyl-CoA dehydrogenase